MGIRKRGSKLTTVTRRIKPRRGPSSIGGSDAEAFSLLVSILSLYRVELYAFSPVRCSASKNPTSQLSFLGLAHQFLAGGFECARDDGVKSLADLFVASEVAVPSLELSLAYDDPTFQLSPYLGGNRLAVA